MKRGFKCLVAGLAAAVICSSLPACAFLKSLKPHPKKTEKLSETPPEKPAVEFQKLVGRVASIAPDKTFVLVQSYGKWDLEAGAILTTHGAEERAANLLVTGEKLSEFAAADIQSGKIEVGDGVYFRQIPKPVTEPSKPSAPTASAEKPLLENVQKNN